jgi:hypothetical protein
LLVTTGAHLRRKNLKDAPLGLALALVANFWTEQESVGKDKGSSLLTLIISNEGKKFYNIDTMEKS